MADRPCMSNLPDPSGSNRILNRKNPVVAGESQRFQNAAMSRCVWSLEIGNDRAKSCPPRGRVQLRICSTEGLNGAAFTEEPRMTSLTLIDRQIRRLTAEEPTCRPFMCDGSPIGCEVVQVGINPSTITPFWPYWNPVTGCDKPGWLAEYIRLRGRLMPTRDRIETLHGALRPLRCLELLESPKPGVARHRVFYCAWDEGRIRSNLSVGNSRKTGW